MARTPDLPPDLATTNVRTQATIDADGRISGETVTTASGPAAISLREIASSIESQGPASAAEDQLRRLGTPGEGGFSFQTPLELSRSYDLRGRFELDETLDDAEDGRLAVPAGMPVLVRSGGFLVSPSASENGDHLCYAGRQSEEIRLTLPPGAHIEQMPRNTRITGGFASYHASYRLVGRTLTVRRELAVTAPRPVCSEADYEAMHPVMMALHRDLRAEIGLMPKGSAPADSLASQAVAQGGPTAAAPQLGTPARLNRPGS
jgi:hypothetical protein